MPEFKLGDRVRYVKAGSINGSRWNTPMAPGETDIVTEITTKSNGRSYLTLARYGGTPKAERFELALPSNEERVAKRMEEVKCLNSKQETE